MNLNLIDNAPFVEGIIHIKSEVDQAGTVKTFDEFEILDRFHVAPTASEDGSVRSSATLAVRAKHPAHSALAIDGGALREIPIKLFFDKPADALQIGYRAYDSETGKPVCSGDGKDAKRLKTSAGDGTQTLSDVACVGCDNCPYVEPGLVNCYRQVRMTVQIEGHGDELSVFEVRSTSINTYKTLRAQLSQISARLGGLRHVPLVLKLWKASNALSSYEPFHCMRLAFRTSERDAFAAAKTARAELATLGLKDETAAAFAPVDALESFFYAEDDDYAATLKLGEHRGRRAGTTSTIESLTARQQRTQGVPEAAGFFESIGRQIQQDSVASP